MISEFLYKSLSADLIQHNHKWEVGKWYKVNDELKTCSNGFHASKNIIDAMGFAPVEVLARVEVKGKCIIEKDKQYWSEMKIKKIYKWGKEDSVSLAIFSAELVLPNFEKVFSDDKRPREAIEIAKNFLKNKNVENAVESAENAAWSSTSAIWGANSAAWSAASAASAAWSVASAENAVWEATMSAMISAMKSAESMKKLEKIKIKCHNFVLNKLGWNTK